MEEAIHEVGLEKDVGRGKTRCVWRLGDLKSIEIGQRFWADHSRLLMSYSGG